MRNWDIIYREQGEVQTKVLPKVAEAASHFKDNGYRDVLDLACGTGRHAIYLAQHGFNVFAGDISCNGLGIARKKAAIAGVTVDFERYDMKCIPYPNAFFDGVVCVWAIGLGTLEEISVRIAEITRVLKTGGRLVTDFISISDKSYGKGRMIENNTFRGAMVGLPDLIEHYSDKIELTGLFTRFHHVEIRESNHFYYERMGKRHLIKALDVEAIK